MHAGETLGKDMTTRLWARRGIGRPGASQGGKRHRVADHRLHRPVRRHRDPERGDAHLPVPAAPRRHRRRARAVQSKHGERLEAGQGALRGDLAATDEHVARIEGAVASALGRPFPERTAQAPDTETGGSTSG